jgi:hypothetical protein
VAAVRLSAGAQPYPPPTYLRHMDEHTK